MSRKKKSKFGARPVDMSLPPQERKRKKSIKRIGGTPIAQLSHGLSSRGRRWARDGERRFYR